MKTISTLLLLTVVCAWSGQAQSRYRASVLVEANLDTERNFECQLLLATVHGCQLTQRLFVGAGVGIQTEFEDVALVPLFAAAQWKFLKGKITPFVDMRLGWAYEFSYKESGLYFAPALGVALGRWSLRAGYTLQRLAGLSTNSITLGAGFTF